MLKRDFDYIFKMIDSSYAQDIMESAKKLKTLGGEEHYRSLQESIRNAIDEHRHELTMAYGMGRMMTLENEVLMHVMHSTLEVSK